MTELTLFHVKSRTIGYGRFGVDLFSALQRLGHTVYDSIDDGRKAYAVPLKPRVEQEPNWRHVQPSGYIAGKSNVVAWCSVGSHAKGWFKGQMPVLYTMYEATQLPETFREGFHNFDLIVVPSEHNLELFSRYHPNVKYVPLGVDTTQWRATPRQEPELFFTFLCGGSGPRKGQDVVVEAFRKAFPEGSWGDGPIPRLILKSPRGNRECMGVELMGDRIETISGRISDDEEIGLYEQAHCYVQPSRGEGFGLQPLQALCQGIPTIATTDHGHGAYKHLVAHPVRTHLDRVPEGSFMFGDSGDWWEPNLNDVVDHMVDIYRNYDAACDVALQTAVLAMDQLSSVRMAERFTAAIGKENMTPYQGSGEWFEPSFKKYRVVTKRDWKADIAGFLHFFKAGEEYWEVADTKRLLHAAGDILDPSCLSFDEDSGLTDEQVQDFEKGTARDNYCPTCTRHLRTGEKRADVILAGRE